MTWVMWLKIQLIVEGTEAITTVLEADKIEFYTKAFQAQFEYVKVTTSMEKLLQWKKDIDELITRFDMEKYK